MSAARHRRLGQPGRLRRPGPADHRQRVGLPARVRAGRAGGGAVPGRPVRCPVYRGVGHRPASTARARDHAARGDRSRERQPVRGRRGRGHARDRGRHRGVGLDAHRRGRAARARPRDQRRLGDPGPRLDARGGAGAGRLARRRLRCGRRQPGSPGSAAVHHRRYRGRLRCPGAGADRRPVRVRAWPGPGRPAGPARPGRRDRRRARRAGRVHVLGRRLGRGRQPGQVRPDRPAPELDRRERPRFRAGGEAWPRARRARREPAGDRAERLRQRGRPGRPGLDHDLYVRASRRQGDAGGAHGRPAAAHAGRGRPRADNGEPGARRRRVGDRPERRPPAGPGPSHRDRIRAGGAAQRVRHRRLDDGRGLSPAVRGIAVRLQVPRPAGHAPARRARGRRRAAADRAGQGRDRRAGWLHPAGPAAGDPGGEGRGGAAVRAGRLPGPAGARRGRPRAGDRGAAPPARTGRDAGARHDQAAVQARRDHPGQPAGRGRGGVRRAARGRARPGHLA